MDIFQLKCLLAAAENSNFTKSAEKLGISKSSFSVQIRNLENELGIPLLNRTTRVVNLTSAGKEFIDYAKKIIADSEQAQKAMENYVSKEKGKLLIGAFPVVRHYGLISQIVTFQKEHPSIKLDIFEGECQDLLDMLNKCVIDVAFLSYINEFHSMDKIDFYHLINDELVLILDKSHRFASRSTIDLKEVEKDSFIFFQPTTAYKDSLDACHAAGFEPQIAFLNPHETRVETILELVIQGLGITMFSSRVAKAYEHMGISIVRFTPRKPRIVTLAVSKQAAHRPLIKDFINFVISHLSYPSTFI